MTSADDHYRQLLDDLQRQFQLLEESRDATEKVTARATAKDRSVAVEANAAGHIVAVEILDTTGLNREQLGTTITICANNAIKAAQEAAEKKMIDFFAAQGAVLDDLADRTGVDLSETVARESHPPAIPDHLLSSDAYRRSRE